MPTYEYRCPRGHEFEHFFRTISSAESSMKCPECGEVSERKMSGGSGLLFKGSGFYITDYGKDGKKDQRKAAESAKGEGGSSGGESGSKSSSDKSSSDKSSGEKSSEKSSGDKSSSKGSGSSDS
ncbi:MAG TPA: zinc ribbon domain-containing protein [Gemmatimonadaceae bacterium]|nr:zinc ribbon domain-containing protein [Gemmatimonadaceae bacterium]